MGIWEYGGVGLGDPGNGLFKTGTSATKASATQIQVSVTPDQGVEAAQLLESVAVGDIVFFQKVGDPAGQSHAYLCNTSAAVTSGEYLQVSGTHLGEAGDTAYTSGDKYILYVVKTGKPRALVNLIATSGISNTAYDNFVDTGFVAAPAAGRHKVEFTAVATFSAVSITLDGRLGYGESDFSAFTALANSDYSWTNVDAGESKMIVVMGIVDCDNAGDFPGAQFKVDTGTVTLAPLSTVITPVS
jgi:hypothetical protein